MNKVLFLSLIACLALTTIVGCKKKSPEKEAVTTLNGTWELRYLAGIQVPDVDPNFKAGNGNVFKFDGQHYDRIIDGKTVSSGTYTISLHKTPVNNTESNYSLVFDNDTKLLINLSKNKLVVFDGVIAADGTESTYEKL
ncbi:MAG: hypothetical protein MUP99_09060 [Pedobacter sp.]|nr:hypothetical protein [Pedobacter sp.]